MPPDVCDIVRVEPWSKDQGPFVEIDKAAFDPKTHKIYTGSATVAPPPPLPVKTTFEASEAAEKLALENDVDLMTVKGTGKDGNIVVKDVEKVIARKQLELLGGVNFASDEAGELAVELGLIEGDLKKIVGTGENGSITVENLASFVDSK